MIPPSQMARPSLRHAIRAAALALAVCQPAGAFTLTFPADTVITTQQSTRVGSHALAIGPWRDGSIPVQMIEGQIRSTAYRVPTWGGSTLELLVPLRDQLVAAGYRVLFECAATICGGFDFRYDTPTLPEPEMHVDLGDYWFLSADRGDDYVSLIVSRSSINGFVQVTSIGGDPAIAPEVPTAAAAALPSADPKAPAIGAGIPAEAASVLPPPPVPAPGRLVEALQSLGAVALDDLSFAQGSADLAPGDYASLAELAAFLAADPARKIALVGHTDMSGTLEANIALSRRRAQSVADRLRALGVARSQLAAQGVGYLAPRQSNLTDAGRAMNRRVEVVLLAGS